jgi:cysteinyl-tRNA synthetase
MIKIYNSLSKKKEDFVPLNPTTVNMYTCGVTVYDDCHIGHGRSLYIFEVIRRFLQLKGYKVNFVRNITDIDDKIIEKAKSLQQEKNLSLDQAFREIKDRYIQSYRKDLQSLSLPQAGAEPQATQNIKEMQEYITKLIQNGFAYAVSGNVYFSVRKFPSYGKLSARKIDELISGQRLESDPNKKDPLDFALWKAAKPQEPSWDSPWGKGRPGWHIECSVMSQKYLAVKTLDIHGGGLDLIFPHHENELAQSQALSQKPFSKYWIHHGLITTNKQKMSKSLNNFVTLNKAVQQYSPNVLKVFYLSSHYRNPLDFNPEKMQESKRITERIVDFAKRLNTCSRNSSDSVTLKELKDIEDKFFESMEDDFNMPAGFASIFDLIGLVNNYWQNQILREDFFSQARALLMKILNVFVITIEDFTEDRQEIEQKIELRQKLRREKKFSQADQIRQELADQGIILEDLPGGKTRWIKEKQI